MVDQWETDSLIVLNNKIKRNLKFDNSLRKEALCYAISMNQWEQIETPDWVLDLIPKEWQGAHGGHSAMDGDYIYGDMVINGERGNIKYTCRRTYHTMSEYDETHCNCSMRKKLSGSASFYVGQGHIISSCYCPHWTSPQKIAEYLDKSIDYSLYKKGAIAIYNDDICTYAVLACK